MFSPILLYVVTMELQIIDLLLAAPYNDSTVLSWAKLLYVCVTQNVHVTSLILFVVLISHQQLTTQRSGYVKQSAVTH